MSAGLPDTSSSYADEGSNAHFLLEYCLKNQLGPLSFVGQVMTEPSRGQEFTVTQEMADAVDVAHKYVIGKYEYHAFILDQKVELHAETKVFPARLLRFDIEGTADIILVTPDFIEVIDYKHGAGVVVEAKGNRQMQIYGIGALDTFGLELGPDRGLITTIIQPRIEHSEGPIRSACYDWTEVAEFTSAIAYAAAQTDEPNPPLAAGEKQCRWCKAKAVCPELAKTSLMAADVMFDDISTVTSDDIQAGVLRDPSQLSPAQISVLLDNEALIKSWLASVHEYAVNQLASGNDVPGFKLVEGRKSKAWKEDEDTIVARLRRMKHLGGGKVTMADITDTKLKSPAAMEKALKKTLTPANWKVVREFIVNKPGNPQLAPETSTKVPVITKAEQMFDDITMPSFLT
jgi:hypothetical protein